MTVEFLQDVIASLEYWSEGKNKKVNKNFAFLRGDVIENVGITEDLFDDNYTTINYQKSSFSVLKKYLKIT